ncbi:hypothetical protein E4T39_04027 [Aureobasidium subglaciale]|nr:hypothetical protein E4T39_04027 [Aureobasidium subglaciale]
MYSVMWSCAGFFNLSQKHFHLNDIHWQISFLKKSIRTPTTSVGSGDVYGSAQVLLYAPFGRIITMLPIVSTTLRSVAAILPLKDRRIPDAAANVVDFESPNHHGSEKSLSEMAKITAQRYPSQTHSNWKTWKSYIAGSTDKKTISWADDSNSSFPNSANPLQLLDNRAHNSFESLIINDVVGEDHASIASILHAHEKVETRLRRHRSSSLLSQNTIPPTPTDNALMHAVIAKDMSSVQHILHQKAADLAFDFEWLGELLELHYSISEIANVLIQEEEECPWLLVSGGNFGKRTLRLSRRLECQKVMNGHHGL